MINVKQVFLSGLITAVLVIPPGLAQAQPAVKRISSSQAQGLEGPIATITVWPGEGTNLNLIPTGETIKKVWLDDPSRITLNFDGALCQLSEADQKQNCKDGSASVIHLRRMHRVKFPSLPRTATTLLSVVTQASSGEKKLYQFRVASGTGERHYRTLSVYPDVPLKTSVLPSESESPQLQLTRIEAGIAVAQTRNLIRPQQPLWQKLQELVGLVRGGVTLQDAARRSGVSMELVTKLAQMGTSSSSFSLPDPPAALTPTGLKAPVDTPTTP